MITLSNIIIGIVFLIVISILDLKTFHLKEGFIPAVLTTSFLIVAFMWAGTIGIYTGIFGALLSLLLVDFDLFHGVADVKVFVACSILLPSLISVAYFGAITSVIAVIYMLLARRIKGLKEIPFVPALLLSFLATWGVLLLL